MVRAQRLLLSCPSFSYWRLRLKASCAKIKDSRLTIKDSSARIKNSFASLKYSHASIKDSSARIKDSCLRIKDSSTRIKDSRANIKDSPASKTSRSGHGISYNLGCQTDRSMPCPYWRNISIDPVSLLAKHLGRDTASVTLWVVKQIARCRVPTGKISRSMPCRCCNSGFWCDSLCFETALKLDFCNGWGGVVRYFKCAGKRCRTGSI